MTISEAIRKIAATGAEIYCKVCTVDAVDEKARTVDCTPIDDDAPLLGVNLQANQESKDGVVLFPSVGSFVVVAFIGSSVGVVVLTEKIDKGVIKIADNSVEINSEGVVINGGNFGSLIKIQKLTDKINALIDAFNEHTHTIPAGGVAVSGSATAQANPAPVSIPAIVSIHRHVQVSDYENDKVKH